MRALKNTIHILLVLVMLAAGLPVYHPTDANRDERTDLADAILRVRELTGSADNPQAFKQRLKDVVATLKVVSGFTRITGTTRTESLSSHQQDAPFLVAFHNFSQPSVRVETIPPKPFSYQSSTLSPPVPPPKL